MKKYSSVSAGSLDAWRQTLNSGVKRRIAMQWFEKIPDVDFESYGYRKHDQLAKLSELSVQLSLRDEFAWRMGSVYFNYQLNVLRWGYRRRRNGQLAYTILDNL